LAFFDGVTGLPNREKFRLDATQIIESRQSGSLWFIDLDGFKSINDTFGHKTGDLLLRKVSERLKIIFADVAATIAHPDDVRLARVAGDEFVAVIPDLADMDKISRTAKSLLESLCIPFEINGAHVNIGASVGITIFPADALTYEDLLINADLAMYAAKERGRNTFALYSAEIAEGARTRLALEQELKNAVRVGQLSVHYQLTVSCYDGSIRGVEALARWHHPTLGTVSPGCFVKIAEETGLVREIDRFILKRAIEEIKSLGEVAQGIVLAVNISAACVEDPFLVGEIEKLLNASKFDPSRLELEITESVAMRDPDTVLKSINELQRLGIRLAIDDFGAGYSNLATLARLPFDTVKLDRSLISGFSSDREKQTIVRIAQAMASELGFETVVEGIEKMQELELVAKFGATYAQGFLFSRPVPIDQLAPLLRPARLSGIAKKALSNDATDRNLTARPTAYVVNG
jgi:diguanylate cyclase (GGDEF)-like protein